MKSMTGFGKADIQTSELAIDVSVRAVNGRFLEVKVYAHKIYSALEIEIRKRVAQKIFRGTVEIYINRKSFSGNEKISFNENLAKDWLRGFNKIAKDLDLETIKQSQILLSIPEFVKVEETSSISTKEKKVLFQIIDQAVQHCVEMRASEGEGLKVDLQKQMKNLLKQLDAVKKLRERTVKDLDKKYRARLEALGLKGEVDEQRMSQEIVFLLDKGDINEEIQRLGAHVDAIEKLIEEKGPIGKKLDFFAQELLREVNTIGSKSTSAELTHTIVEAKGFVEKYREQVQNVE